MIEREREPVAEAPTREQIEKRAADGWRLAAVEWERERSEPRNGSRHGWFEQIPFGLRIAADCKHLEANPRETEVLTLAMQMIVQDRNLSEVAQQLNLEGHTTRAGRRWTPGDVFDLLPRLIQVGPQIFSAEDWAERRKHLNRAL